MENSSVVKVANDKRLRVGDLKERILRLFNQNLITEIEKKSIISKLENPEIALEVLNLLMDRDIELSINILKVLKGSEAVPVTTSNRGGISDIDGFVDRDTNFDYIPADNPLKVPVILQQILNFLSLEYLKSSRLVCQEWNSVAEPLLSERAQISIGYPKYPDCFSKSIANFNYVFQYTHEKMRFKALRLTKFQGNHAPWPTSDLKEIFQFWGKNLKELTIDHLEVERMYYSSYRGLPLCNVLSVLPDLNITKLTVKIPNPKLGFLYFVLDQLTIVKYIRLEGCVLQITEDCRISPIEFEVRDGYVIHKDDVKIISLNKFIRFENMKKFTFGPMKSFGEASLHLVPLRAETNVTLDLAGSYELNRLHLTGISISNWNSSNWKIGQLKFVNCQRWEGYSNISVREMLLEDKYNFSPIDIPVTIEKLTMRGYYHPLTDIFLPDLKHLILSEMSPNKLKYFKNCEHLSVLEMTKINESGYERVIAVRDFPPSIKNLRIQQSVPFKVTEKRNISLDKLVSDKCGLPELLTFLKKIQPKCLVVIFAAGGKYSKGSKNLLNLLSDQRYDSIAIGPFKWTTVNFGTSSLSKLVDKEAEYYLFRNNKGKAIEEEEFKNTTKLI